MPVFIRTPPPSNPGPDILGSFRAGVEDKRLGEQSMAQIAAAKAALAAHEQEMQQRASAFPLQQERARLANEALKTDIDTAQRANSAYDGQTQGLQARAGMAMDEVLPPVPGIGNQEDQDWAGRLNAAASVIEDPRAKAEFFHDEALRRKDEIANKSAMAGYDKLIDSMAIVSQGELGQSAGGSLQPIVEAAQQIASDPTLEPEKRVAAMNDIMKTWERAVDAHATNFARSARFRSLSEWGMTQLGAVDPKSAAYQASAHMLGLFQLGKISPDDFGEVMTIATSGKIPVDLGGGLGWHGVTPEKYNEILSHRLDTLTGAPSSSASGSRGSRSSSAVPVDEVNKRAAMLAGVDEDGNQIAPTAEQIAQARMDLTPPPKWSEMDDAERADLRDRALAGEVIPEETARSMPLKEVQKLAAEVQQARDEQKRAGYKRDASWLKAKTAEDAKSGAPKVPESSGAGLPPEAKRLGAELGRVTSALGGRAKDLAVGEAASQLAIPAMAAAKLTSLGADGLAVLADLLEGKPVRGSKGKETIKALIERLSESTSNDLLNK